MRFDPRTRRGRAPFRAWLAVGALASIVFAAPGCGESSAAQIAKYPLKDDAAALPAGAPLYQGHYLRNELFGVREPRAGEVATSGFFGSPAEPTLWNMVGDDGKPLLGGDPKTGHTEHLQIGRDLFRKHCLHCHGIWGRGDGSTAEWLNPRPRNFWRGKFKFKSAEGSKPTRDDLLQTIRQGAHGTAMPAFRVLEDETVGAHAASLVNGDERLERALRAAEGQHSPVLEYLADYVIYLSTLGEVQRLSAKDIATETADDPSAMGAIVAAKVRENYELVRDQWVNAPKKVVSPSPTVRRPGLAADGAIDVAAMYESAKKGRALFLTKEWQCTQCHGENATGRAPQADLVESWRKTFDKGEGWESMPQPADLTLGWYHRGGRAVDQWRQITLGVDPMPAFNGPQFPELDRWHLVNYVRAVPYWGAELERAPADLRTARAPAGGH
jgi:mono/diheme cytochrome c family protein